MSTKDTVAFCGCTCTLSDYDYETTPHPRHTGILPDHHAGDSGMQRPRHELALLSRSGVRAEHRELRVLGQAPNDNGDDDINKHDFFNKLHHDIHYPDHVVVYDNNVPIHVHGPAEHVHDDYDGTRKYHHDCPACVHEYAAPNPRAAFRGDLLDLADEDLLD